MDFVFYFGVAVILSVWSAAECAGIPNGVLHMECHDRYFMIAVDLSFTGEEPVFEAVDETGVYPITTQYAAVCGYSVDVRPLAGRVELRASYFSCHADNKDDEVFTFHFNLVTTHEGKEATYALNRTCSPSLSWSPREVTCELNYMEVSVRSEVTCPTGTRKDDWDALKPAHSSTTSDWQVMFHRAEEQLPPMNLSEARKQGYMFDLTDGRLVFRTPYGQPDSFSTEVNGVPVEVVHATLFSRQSWVVLMVDLVAACSMHEGSYDDSGYVVWASPETLYPSSDSMRLNFGLNGELVEQPVAEERGCVVEKHNTSVLISIPYNAEGGYRKSFVSGDLYEFYVFHLYVEQILVDEDLVETRLRFHRTLATPLLPCPVFTENQTLLEDRMFTVYLGDIPEDVDLAAVHLNGQEFTVPFMNTSSNTITKVVHPNKTHGYTLKVPFDDAVVIQQFSKEDAVLQYKLDINYTLTVLPGNESFYHLASIEALFTDVSPPAFDAVCSESGISFRLDHRPFDYLWVISISSDPLTSELAAQHGYIMSNDSQSLQLEVPLFTHGYEYKDVSLNGFSGTFELLVRDHETSEVTSSTVRTCPFSSSEFIMCSTDGRMTVVADLSLAIPSGGVPARTNLIDKYCGPKETDGTRALFSFPLNSCGSIVKLGKENVTYENEIFYKKNLNRNKAVSDDAPGRVVMQCSYPLAGLHRLFSVYRFESDAAGVGSIIRTTQPATGVQSPTIKPTKAPTTTPAIRRPFKLPTSYLPAHHPPARYVKVSLFHNHPSVIRKGAEGNSQRSRQPTLPPLSSRTLHHPSFVPLYMVSGFERRRTDQTVHPVIIPAEFFYTDPTMSCGSRITNIVSDLTVFECFQLNTPPPLMSTCPAPPPRPDPFRCGPHPTLDLGSLTLKTNNLRPPAQPGRLVLQLTQEEDQAVTNLLKLHHQELEHSDETVLVHPERSEAAPAFKPLVQRPREGGNQGRWSDTELEAADTLLCGFSLREEEKICCQKLNKLEATLPDRLQHPHQGCEAEQTVLETWNPSSVSAAAGDFLIKSRSSVSGGLPEVKKRTLSDPEGDAVRVLLSLGDTGALDVEQ
uniref:uncharacterized protein n=1 Tax=Semicossyphus pulcher TaxID=241346 RepID=UPI0037E7FA49